MCYIYKCLSPWQQKLYSKSNTSYDGPRPFKIGKYFFTAMIDRPVGRMYFAHKIGPANYVKDWMQGQQENPLLEFILFNSLCRLFPEFKKMFRLRKMLQWVNRKIGHRAMADRTISTKMKEEQGVE